MRYAVLFVMDLKSRRVEIAGIIHNAYAEWMLQIVRNLTDGVDGFLLPTCYLIMDRDPTPPVEWRIVKLNAKPIRNPYSTQPSRSRITDQRCVRFSWIRPRIQ